MAVYQRRGAIKIALRGCTTSHATGTGSTPQPMTASATAVPMPHPQRRNDNIGRSFRPLLCSLGENLSPRPFVVLELDPGGILQCVPRADTVPWEVRSSGTDGGSGVTEKPTYEYA